MIEVTRLKGKKMMINAELIETVERLGYCDYAYKRQEIRRE